MNYEESRAYIRAAELKKGIVLGLENMRELMRRLGDPQDELKYVHVAGTNGKGSVIAYLYSALSGAGYRVGRYISPAVYSYRERMEVNGEPVSREKFAAYVTRIAEVIDEIVKEVKPHRKKSFFCISKLLLISKKNFSFRKQKMGSLTLYIFNVEKHL